MSAKIKGITLFLAITIAIFSVYFSVMAKPDHKESKTIKKATVQYFLGEFNGKLAIYKTDSNTPLEVLDIEINSLPERDITRINNKIHADTLNEIISIVEDYEWFFLYFNNLLSNIMDIQITDIEA